jgi:membrane-bound inhibitor of C-type lysozyme
MRKPNALLFMMLFVIATVSCPINAVSQAVVQKQPVSSSVYGPFYYTCEDGTHFSITFYNSSDAYTAIIKVNGGASQKLASEEATTGLSYSGSRYSYGEGHSYSDGGFHDEFYLTDNTKAFSQQITSCVELSAHAHKTRPRP